MTTAPLLDMLNSPRGGDMLESLYGQEMVEPQRQRYRALIHEWTSTPAFSDSADTRIISAPGRTELGGNHTDHNRGKVLAAAIQMDAVAVVAPRADREIVFRSTGFPDVTINLDDSGGRPGLAPRPEEQGTTDALIRGIAAAFAARGVSVGGVNAVAASTVLPGSGLSSSAAVEVLWAKIFDSLYNEGRCSALELAQMSQKAENEFFGKPSGLMDQAASAFGGAVAIDFADPVAPEVTAIAFDPLDAGFALCVINTRGNHADLTPDYAAIPQEMNAVARYFGKSFLREVDYAQVWAAADGLRAAVGDRALLRAMHFFHENHRAGAMAALLQKREPRFMEPFLDLVNESGNSSGDLLQNLYSPPAPHTQGLPLAIAVSREFFRERGIRAACRVHGGGFAGTIQAYVPREELDAYRARMEKLFGADALTILRIRPHGAVEFGSN